MASITNDNIVSIGKARLNTNVGTVEITVLNLDKDIQVGDTWQLSNVYVGTVTVFRKRGGKYPRGGSPISIRVSSDKTYCDIQEGGVGTLSQLTTVTSGYPYAIFEWLVKGLNNTYAVVTV